MGAATPIAPTKAAMPAIASVERMFSPLKAGYAGVLKFRFDILDFGVFGYYRNGVWKGRAVFLYAYYAL